ncbi:MAG: ThuA domain-containing protein [Acidobacteriota bacterium]|nr:ThuA domain-containing protein [Acidobacteriota bacterium]
MTTRAEDLWLTYEGGTGPGAGKHIVLVSGDEEYRSEEALPLLGRILAEAHGFRATVLFAIDPDSGQVDPENVHNIPGLEHLASADAMVLFTRFRELPDAQMKHFVDYFEAGKPIVAMRTATHAFFYRENLASPYSHYSFNSETWEGGFGRQVLGETWVNHHGRHKFEATRGIVEAHNAAHPILRGIDDVFVPTDVYGVRDLPAGTDVLLRGQVLSGMEPTSPPVDGEQNDPMMPLAWVREYRGTKATNRIFATTMGSSSDLLSEGFRRLLVNAVFWAAGIESDIPLRAEVPIPASYRPTFYGFGDQRRGLRPSDFAP